MIITPRNPKSESYGNWDVKHGLLAAGTDLCPLLGQSKPLVPVLLGGKMTWNAWEALLVFHQERGALVLYDWLHLWTQKYEAKLLRITLTSTLGDTFLLLK